MDVLLNKWNYICISLIILIIYDFAMDKIFDIYFDNDETIVIMEDEDKDEFRN